MKKNKNITLILLILLLLISSFLAIWGYLQNQKGVNKQVKLENVNKEFKFNNKLYFYNESNLLGTYDCKTEKCDYATGVLDDKTYALNYYDKAKEEKIKMILNKYAFISDDDKVLLYDIVNKRVINTFKAVKNYEIGIDNNYYILKDMNDKWGVMKIAETPELIIDYKYDFIGLHNELNEGNTLLKSDIFVIKNVNGWKLIDNKGLDKSSYITNQIHDYSDKYIITKVGNYYYINNRESGNLLMSNAYSYARFINKYIALVDTDNVFYIMNPENLASVSQKYKVTLIDEVGLADTSDGIAVSIGGILKEMIR